MSISIADIKNALWSTAAAARLKAYLDELAISYGAATDITNMAAGDSRAAGTSPKVARADHKHGAPANATTSAAGLMSAADKTKSDAVTTANLPSADEKAALAGTSGTAPSVSNKLVDSADSRLLAAANLAKVISNVATIAQGANSVAVTLPADYTDKPVVALFKTPGAGISATAIGYLAASISGTTLTIEHISKDNVAINLQNAQQVYYIIDAR